jgi:DNA-binding protein YbaB
MFGSLKNLGAMASLMGKREQIAEAFKRVQGELEERKITVNAPDNSVQVIVNGHMKVLSVNIAPEALVMAAQDPQAAEQLNRVLAGAYNAAAKRVKEVASEMIKREAEALGLPDVPNLDKLLGG